MITSDQLKDVLERAEALHRYDKIRCTYHSHSSLCSGLYQVLISKSNSNTNKPKIK